MYIYIYISNNIHVLTYYIHNRFQERVLETVQVSDSRETPLRTTASGWFWWCWWWWWCVNSLIREDRSVKPFSIPTSGIYGL